MLDNIPDGRLPLRSDGTHLLSTLILEAHALGTRPTHVADKTGLVAVMVEPGLWLALLWAVNHQDALRLERVQT